ncbi:MAG: M48 family metalloprotease [Planctomycetota bacterium]
MPTILPIEFDSYLGYSSTGAVESEYGGVSNDANLVSRANAIGRRLSPQTEFRRDVPYQFKVLDTNQVNAFALPGGPVYATKGLMAMTDNDDKLASVLGHELGHINARHSINSMQLILGLGVIDKALRSYLKKSDKLDLSADELENIKQINAALMGFARLGYSRENEYEADAKGLNYAHSAGYNPYGMVAFMQKLQEAQGREPTKLEEFFSTHPATKKRISEMNGIIARNYPDAKPLVETSAGQLVVRSVSPVVAKITELWAKPAVKWSAIGAGVLGLGYLVYKVKSKKSEVKSNPQIPKELEALAQEARKYKSAEEFIKALHNRGIQWNLRNELSYFLKISPSRIEMVRTGKIPSVREANKEDKKELSDFYAQATGRPNPRVPAALLPLIKEAREYDRHGFWEAIKSGKFDRFRRELDMAYDKYGSIDEIYNLSRRNPPNLEFITHNSALCNPVPEFRSTQEAVAYGRSIAGNKDKINELKMALEQKIMELQQYKYIISPDYQEMSDIACQKSFIREALEAAGRPNPDHRFHRLHGLNPRMGSDLATLGLLTAIPLVPPL